MTRNLNINIIKKRKILSDYFYFSRSLPTLKTEKTLETVVPIIVKKNIVLIVFEIIHTKNKKIGNCRILKCEYILWI